jgi:hypothetical protein
MLLKLQLPIPISTTEFGCKIFEAMALAKDFGESM